jgi:hypothetical protein
MKFDFKNLPRLKVVEILNAENGICTVQVDSKDWIYNGRVYVFATPAKLILGKLNFNESDKLLSNVTGKLSLETPNDISGLENGKEYNFLDGYWGELTQLVLSEAVWTKTDFKTQNCYGQLDEKTGKIKVIRSPGFSPSENDESWVLVENGWDHEHCSVCCATICDKECHKASCYISTDKEYVCESCYEKYVSKKNWDFTEMQSRKSK